jgi:LysM repeat protein
MNVIAPRAPATRLLRRQVLVRFAAVGSAVVLVACSGASTRSNVNSKRRKPVVASTTTTTPAPISYQVKRGDNLTSLARFFGVSTAVLASFNHLGITDQLTVGQVLQIPPRPPVHLVVAPADAPAGQVFTLSLAGAQGGETVTFEVDAPGAKFTGPPHAAAADGSVSATYQTNPIDTPGTYTVVATGDHGTSVRATFRVDPYSPST